MSVMTSDASHRHEKITKGPLRIDRQWVWIRSVKVLSGDGCRHTAEKISANGMSGSFATFAPLYDPMGHGIYM